MPLNVIFLENVFPLKKAKQECKGYFHFHPEFRRIHKGGFFTSSLDHRFTASLQNFGVCEFCFFALRFIARQSLIGSHLNVIMSTDVVSTNDTRGFLLSFAPKSPFLFQTWNLDYLFHAGSSFTFTLS